MFKDYANYWIKTFITNVFVTRSVLRSQKALRNMNTLDSGLLRINLAPYKSLVRPTQQLAEKQTQVG